jgi:hypothetical protein
VPAHPRRPVLARQTEALDAEHLAALLAALLARADLGVNRGRFLLLGDEFLRTAHHAAEMGEHACANQAAEGEIDALSIRVKGGVQPLRRNPPQRHVLKNAFAQIHGNRLIWGQKSATRPAMMTATTNAQAILSPQGSRSGAPMAGVTRT